VIKIKGMRVGEPQRFSNRVNVWPIRGGDVGSGVGFVGDVELASDDDYGGMTIMTKHPGGAIAPVGMAFFIPDGQDRALRESTFVPCGVPVEVKTLCLDPFDGGLWGGQKKVDHLSLPPSLVASIPSSDTHSYADLWDSISLRSASNGGNSRTVKGLIGEGHGRALVNRQKLPEDARGALVTLDGRVVALYVAPSSAGFQSWWGEYGLANAYEYESRTLPTLPLPIGSGGDEVLDVSELDGMVKEVTFMDILVGWVYAVNGRLVYAQMSDREAWKTYRARVKPQDEERVRRQTNFTRDEWEERS
jgi:hypothetical protein